MSTVVSKFVCTQWPMSVVMPLNWMLRELFVMRRFFKRKSLKPQSP